MTKKDMILSHMDEEVEKAKDTHTIQAQNTHLLAAMATGVRYLVEISG